MRGRFAPSPTGELHIGNLRTALWAWLFARHAGSEFILRFEDLDPATVRAEHYDGQRRDLERIGVDWDTEVRQADDLDRYRSAIDALASQGSVYRCYCSRREIQEASAAPHGDLPEGAYPGTCRDLSTTQRSAREADGRPYALRLRTDGSPVSFVDTVHGEASARLDDMVLARRDGMPAYNLAVVVDDAAQGIEHVVRGDDLLLSTPRQLHLGRLLGRVDPVHSHVPLVLGDTGSRLAKRDGAVTLENREALGETPAQVRGLLAASMGLACAGAEPTPFELLDAFDPSSVPTEPWTFGGGSSVI